MSGKKVNSIRKPQSMTEKMTDQMLSSASRSSVYGKIEPPKAAVKEQPEIKQTASQPAEEPAQNSGKKNNNYNNYRNDRRKNNRHRSGKNYSSHKKQVPEVKPSVKV